MTLKCLFLSVVLAGLSASCGDDGGSPDEKPAPPPAPVVAKKVHPTLTLDSPARSVYVNGEVVVSGMASPGSAPLSKLTISGTEVPLQADGRFEHRFTPVAGPNIVAVRVTAEDMGRAVDALTVFGGEVWNRDQALPGAMGVHLGPTFLDDNDDDLDDLARIAELVLQDEGFLSAFTSEAFVFDDQSIAVTAVTISDVDVQLVPEVDCLSSRIILGQIATGDGAGVHLEMDVSETSASILVDFVDLDARRITIQADVCPTGAGDSLVYEVRDPSVLLEGLVLSSEQYPNLSEVLPDSINAAVASLIEDTIIEWMGTSLGSLVGGFIDAFALEYTIADITGSFEIEAVRVGPSGLELSLSTHFSAPVRLGSFPEGAGSMRTDDPPLEPWFSKAPIAVALSDDAMNQLLYAVWYSDVAGGYDIPPEVLLEMPEVFQPISMFEIQLDLPMTLIDGTEDEYNYDIALGGMRMLVDAGLGRRFDLGVHARAGVDISVADNRGVNFMIDNRAQKITVQANVGFAPPGVEPGSLAALLRVIVPTILGESNAGLSGFPIPSVELGAFAPSVASFQGRSLTFVLASSEKTGSGGGFVVVEGTLEEVP